MPGCPTFFQSAGPEAGGFPSPPAQLAKLTVKIPVKVGANGRLVGSVTGKDVSDVLKKQHNIDMDKRKIALKSEITGPGLYEAVIKVHPEITSTIKVEVVAN